jgi:hypothetical protein
LFKKIKANKNVKINKGDKLRKKLNIVINSALSGMNNGLLIEEIK